MTELLGVSPLVRAIGVALVEFLWQGALLAGVAGAMLLLMRRSSPSARHAVACTALAAMAVASGLTAWSAYVPDREPIGIAVEVETAPTLAGLGGTGTPAATIVSDAWLPAVVLAWMIGVLGLAARLGVGWIGVGRMRRSGIDLSPDRQRDLLALAGRVGVARFVRLAESARVVVPTVIGWIRPVILLPTSTLSGLSPEQLDAILIHELAHVRRHDYLINLGQSVVETLLFYHPAVWWLSKRIRAERELCCDDVVVAACADRVMYARALASLEEHRLQTAALSLGADGGNLVGRIRRLLDTTPAERRRPAAAVVAGLIAALPLLFVVEMRGSVAAAPDILLSTPEAPIAATPGPQSGASGSEPLVDKLAALRERLGATTQTPPPSPPSAASPDAIVTEVRLARSKAIASMLEEARRHVDAGRYAEALLLLNEVTVLLPQDPASSSTAPGIRESLTVRAPGAGVVGGVARRGVGPTSPFRVGGAIPPPVKIHDVKPIYPQAARDARVQGLVIIEALVDSTGLVAETRVLRGDPMLVAAAVDAVSLWRYAPATLDGHAVPVNMTVTVNFTLND